MKTAFLAAALAFSFAAPAAFAQMAPQADPAQQNQVQRHAPNPQKMAMRISRQLNLTPGQTAKLEPILADRQEKVMALRSDTTLTDAQRKKQMHTVQMSTRMQMANVLSPDQMKQLKAMRKQKMQNTAPPAGV
jgi:Spy/CpxP family protein refolding chaperone